MVDHYLKVVRRQVCACVNVFTISTMWLAILMTRVLVNCEKSRAETNITGIGKKPCYSFVYLLKHSLSKSLQI